MYKLGESDVDGDDVITEKINNTRVIATARIIVVLTVIISFLREGCIKRRHTEASPNIITKAKVSQPGAWF